MDLIQEEGLLFLWVTGRAMELARECLQVRQLFSASAFLKDTNPLVALALLWTGTAQPLWENARVFLRRLCGDAALGIPPRGGDLVD